MARLKNIKTWDRKNEVWVPDLFITDIVSVWIGPRPLITPPKPRGTRRQMIMVDDPMYIEKPDRRRKERVRGDQISYNGATVWKPK